MKFKIKTMRAFYALASGAIILSSCQKSDSINSDDTMSAATIAVAASVSASSASVADSVYIVQPCKRGERRDSIAQAGLPASVASYLAANYAGYTFSKAFAIKNSTAAIVGYAVVVYLNNKPIGLQFNPDGSFVKVLEQREKGDLSGPGHHRGGRFENRDGEGRDSISIAALAASITSYFITNYPTDTLVKAFKNRDNSIIVLSNNNGAFATIFSAGGAFIKREKIQQREGNCKAIELSSLPSMAANYLAQIYPNYVFEKAFSITQGGKAKGFVVFIDANNTKYAVEFDIDGNFVHAKTIF